MMRVCDEIASDGGILRKTQLIMVRIILLADELTKNTVLYIVEEVQTVECKLPL